MTDKEVGELWRDQRVEKNPEIVALIRKLVEERALYNLNRFYNHRVKATDTALRDALRDFDIDPKTYL